MSEYKLMYMNVRSYGEPIRLVLLHKGINFEDVRFDRNEFYVNQELKKLTPYGKVPVLEIKGQRPIAQSGAILRHLARKFGLNGKNEEEATYLDELYGFICDCYSKFAAFLVVHAGKVEGDKEKLYKENFTPGASHFLQVLNKILGESKSGYLLQSGLSYIDFVVADHLYSIENANSTILNDYPKLVELKEKVYSLSGVKEHVKERPKSLV